MVEIDSHITTKRYGLYVAFASSLLMTVVIGGCNESVGDASNLHVCAPLVYPEIRQVGYVRSTNTEPIRPLIAPKNLPRQKVLLGRTLFHDVRLSKDNSISCATCHSVSEGGDDGLAVAVGINSQTGTLNSPTVLNSSLSIAQFWDGRAQTLAEQVSGPVHNPIEMGSSWNEVIEKLGTDTKLVKRFNQVYSDGLNSENIVDAIATYETALITLNSPFDLYLMGDLDAISEDALKGYELFKSIGCISCHQGQSVGGNMFQEFGIMGEFTDQFREESESQNGRFNVTNRDKDLHRFKVPSLRNSELTAPYFHDGSAETLEEAISTMAEFQLGESLASHEINQIRAFLHSLTGEVLEELK